MKSELSLLFSLGFCTLGQDIFLKPAKAQVVPDGTTNTTVDVSGNDFTINQGNRAGGNLFHSFGEFSVLTGGSAFFNNAADIVNIFSRVTGGNISNIDGLLRANGSANLFLLNPAGIIFGPGARLNIGGSFYGSTADSILFPDGEFSATDLNNPPLITINAPIGLNFRDNPGDIVNRSDLRVTEIIDEGTEDESTSINRIGLRVNQGQNITLIGGNVSIEDSGITAPGGRIDLGGLSAAGTVTLNEDGSWNFPEDVALADINLTEASKVDVGSIAGGGSITINARNLNVEGLEGEDIANDRARIVSDTDEGGMGDTGNITINADSILLDFSTIRNRVESEAVGNSGNVTINTGSLEANNRSRIVANNQGTGDSGNISINADSITLEGLGRNNETFIRTGIEENAVGNAGDINITTNSLTLNNRSIIESRTLGQGNAGNIVINAADSINLNGNRRSEILSEVDEDRQNNDAMGNAGNITLNTRELNLNRGSRVSSSSYAQGNAGNITINASERVVLEDRGRVRSQLIEFMANNDEVFPMFVPTGNGGDITINTQELTLTNESRLNTNNRGSSSKIGSIIIDANNVSLEGNSRIVGRNRGTFSVEEGGERGRIQITAENNISIKDYTIVSTGTDMEAIGDAGDIILDANTISLTTGGRVDASTQGVGKAGDIMVNADDSVNISGVAPFPRPEGETQGTYSSGLIARTEAGAEGRGGDITVTTPQLTLSDGGVVSTISQSASEGGDITVNADSLEIAGGGQIQATAFSNGMAGNINLDINNQITIDGQITFEDSDPTFKDRFNSLVNPPDSAESGIFAKSGIFANTTTGSQGDGGNINIGIFDAEGNLDTTQFTGEINLSNQGTITADSEGAGSRGIITDAIV